MPEQTRSSRFRSPKDEDDFWLELEEIRHAANPASETPVERFRREQTKARRAADHGAIHRQLTGSSVHDGSAGTVLLLEVLRQLRSLKALVLKQRR
jgi:hypothetical protein